MSAEQQPSAVKTGTVEIRSRWNAFRVLYAVEIDDSVPSGLRMCAALEKATGSGTDLRGAFGDASGFDGFAVLGFRRRLAAIAAGNLMLICTSRVRRWCTPQHRHQLTRSPLRPQPHLCRLALGLDVLRLLGVDLQRPRLVVQILDFIDRMALGDGVAHGVVAG